MNPRVKKIKDFWKDFSSNKVAVISLIIFTSILFVAVFAPLVSPTAVSYTHLTLPTTD